MECNEIIEKMSIIQPRITSALRPISRPYQKEINLQRQKSGLVTGWILRIEANHERAISLDFGSFCLNSSQRLFAAKQYCAPQDFVE